MHWKLYWKGHTILNKLYRKGSYRIEKLYWKETYYTEVEHTTPYSTKKVMWEEIYYTEEDQSIPNITLKTNLLYWTYYIKEEHIILNIRNLKKEPTIFKGNILYSKRTYSTQSEQTILNIQY